MHYNGLGVKQDYMAAFNYFSKATISADAHYYLGLMYYSGYGVNVDYKKSYQEFILAAQLSPENNQALIWLGFLRDSGKGVPQDFVKSYIFFNIAAMDGNAEAVKDRDAERIKLTPSQLEKAQSMTQACIENVISCD
jgi:uncharacterized protein